MIDLLRYLPEKKTSKERHRYTSKYTDEFKKEVVNYYYGSSYNKTAEKFGVSKRSVERWVKA